MSHPIALDTLVLAKGTHDSREDGVCLLEAVAWFAGRGHTDTPPCVSPLLRKLGTSLNDGLPDERRQSLKSLIPRMVGTAGDGLDKTRSYMTWDWLARVYIPAWLDLAGLTAEATALRSLPRITNGTSALRASPLIADARAKAYVARAAAREAARDSAKETARAAARETAREAAEMGVWDDAWDSVWDGSREAEHEVAWGVTRFAALGAVDATYLRTTWGIAFDVARVHYHDVVVIAQDAAMCATTRASLQTTVNQLQLSAIQLLTDMLSPPVPA